jgi:hypothetical protein
MNLSCTNIGSIMTIQIINNNKSIPIFNLSAKNNLEDHRLLKFKLLTQLNLSSINEVY